MYNIIMYNQNNIMTKLIIIKPKYHIVHFIKENSFFCKIIGYNKSIKI
jgi:hypothetical protein